MNELHLFAGAGGGILGGMLLGHKPVCAVEIEPYCREVLLQRQRDRILPWFPIWDDVRTFDGKPWRGVAEVVCGGFPCQDISAAGKGNGIDGDRSGLWQEMARIICEVRPRYALVENSPMLTSRGLGRVLGDLADLGFDARWGVLGADAVGLPHHRARIWVVAYSNDGRERKQSHGWPIKRVGWKWEPISQDTDWERTVTSCTAGNDDVVAYRMDRIGAIGNGQVPAVAALAWKILAGKDF